MATAWVMEDPGELDPKDTLLARRLEHLYKTRRPANGKKKYSDQDVVDAINAAARETIVCRTHLYNLRTGRSDNPTYKLIIALSRHFDVSPSYFFPDDAAFGAIAAGRAEAEAALRIDGVPEAVLEFAALPPRARCGIRQVIAAARRAIDNAQGGGQEE